jgi:4-amino-4-deoxychorismate lyase
MFHQLPEHSEDTHHSLLQDRGLAYGDGLFETIRVENGQPVLFQEHLQRLYEGCRSLGIPPQLAHWVAELNRKSAQLQFGILKLIVTRGCGGRGYRPSQQPQTRSIFSEFPPMDYSLAQKGIKAQICKIRLAQQPVLAGIKHLNRLEQVLASQELLEGIHEGFMFDTQGNLIEGTRSNVFVAINGKLYTPSLDQCGIAGVLRAELIRFFSRDNSKYSPVSICQLSQEHLIEADEIFFCNSVAGVWPVLEFSLDDQIVSLPHGSFSAIAQEHFTTLMVS